MGRVGIAMDLGTSGFRGQAIDLGKGNEIISTAITTRHPLPGANVMDHLHFAVEMGVEVSQQIIVSAVNRVIESLRIPTKDVVRLAVCGNPIQLSLFCGMEIRDLAYAGKSKLESLGVVPPQRDANILKAKKIEGLTIPSETEVIIPPAIQHEVGADALAMMVKSGMLERDEVAITTDYGTNAEMALMVQGNILTGSTAAGPALEGQQIKYGLLATPGAISDIINEDNGYRCIILDENMLPEKGDLVDVVTGKVLSSGRKRAQGITGTGVISLVSVGIEAGIIQLPRITTIDAELHLPDGIRFSQKDLLEAGKAIGAVRAGHMTFCEEARIGIEEITTAYMSGASGTYVDAIKAQKIGLIPAGVKRIYQVGNTSLAMARDMVTDTNKVWGLQAIAKRLRQTHCMFAASKVFEKIYVLELSYWTEGMPWEQYVYFLKRYGFSSMSKVERTPEVIRMVQRDIPDLGRLGLKIIPDIGEIREVFFEACRGDKLCVQECPENALSIQQEEGKFKISIDVSKCLGMACRRCEGVCTQGGFDITKLFHYRPKEKVNSKKRIN